MSDSTGSAMALSNSSLSPDQIVNLINGGGTSADGTYAWLEQLTKIIDVTLDKT
jgi:hypothetical protein